MLSNCYYLEKDPPKKEKKREEDLKQSFIQLQKLSTFSAHTHTHTNSYIYTLRNNMLHIPIIHTQTHSHETTNHKIKLTFYNECQFNDLLIY